MSLFRIGIIGIIGDVHACDARLEAALSFLRHCNVERILCVGDIVDGFGNGERCCALLQAFDVAAVRGNHDRWILNDEMRDLDDSVALSSLSENAVAFLRALPATLSFETTRGPLLLCHGVGENDMNRLTPDDTGYALECNQELQELKWAGTFRFAVGGHTHQRMVRRFGSLTFINAGALPDWSGPCFSIIDFGRGCVDFYGFDGDKVGELAEKVML